MTISVGDQAPQFTLQGTGGKSYSLSEFTGKPVVLVFYPADNTPVCTKQLCSYNNEMSEFNSVGAQVVGISSQDVASHDEFSGKHGFSFPLLADVDKSVSKQYGILGPLGLPRRSVFVIDGSGVVRYVHRALVGLSFRPVGELVAAVEKAKLGQ